MSIGPEHLLGAAIALGCLSIGLLLARAGIVTTLLRLSTLCLGNLAYLAYWLLYERRAGRELSRIGVSVSLTATSLVAIAFSYSPSEVSAASNLAACLLATTSGTTLLLLRLFQPIDEERQRLRGWLSQPASLVRGDVTEQVDVTLLRPGQEILLHAGEAVVVDATVVAGTAEIYPWFGATVAHAVGPEDFVYAGARLASGQLRVTVRWTGLDRHWERLTNDPARCADVHAPVVRLARTLGLRGVPIVLLLSLATGLGSTGSPMHWALIVLAGASALLSPALHRLPALRIAQSVMAAQSQGIVFRSANALDAAARVSSAVFCARGTLLLGEPELSSIDTMPGTTPDEALALAAGAEQSGQHPAAVALMRAARARGVVPDAVRSPHSELGLGVTAVAGNGKPLVVGSRGLLLRERVSIAKAEARITELEAMGRNVVLVALGHHLVGILALQDGLRAGARAAVQHLMDAGIEPILLSGDARKSCESLGRAIDIEHVRPEVLPSDRGKEIERLKSGGAAVAVIGRSPIDEVALSAASVSVALPNAGTPNMDHDIELAANEVQKAALALWLAQKSRAAAIRSLVLGCGGAVVSVLSIVALSAPLAFIPLACMGFTLAASATMPLERRWVPRTSPLDR